MAMEKMGVNLVAQGASQFARDLGHVAASIISYQKSIASAQASEARQQSSSAKLQATLARLNLSYQSSSNNINNLTAKLNNLAASYSRISARSLQGLQLNLGNLNSTQLERLRTMLDGLRQVSNIQGMNPEFSKDLESAIRTVDSFTNSLGKLEIATQKQQGIANSISSLGQGVSGGGGLGSALGIISNIQPVIMGFTIALDVLKFSINTVINAFKLFYSILSAIGSAIWGVIKFVGNLAYSLISIPFNFVINAFNGIAGSIRRIIEIAIGMGLENILFSLSAKFRELGRTIIQAAKDFQFLQIRLEGLVASEIFDNMSASAEEATGKVVEFNDALAQSKPVAKELFDWTTALGIQSPYKVQDVANILTLGKSYEFTVAEAKSLTESVVTFSSAMGLEDVSMKRIIENFGQMRAQGKMTGTEIRDLARGSYVPVTKIFETMAKMANEASVQYKDLSTAQKKEMEIANPANLEKLKLLASLSGKTGEQLHALGSSGAIDVNLFFDAFQRIVKDRFPDALDRMNKSIEVAWSNTTDLFQAIVGFRIIKPIFDELGGSINEFIGKIFTQKNLDRADMLGTAFSNMASAVMDLASGLDKVVSNAFPKISKNLDNFLKGFLNVTNLIKKSITGNKSVKEFLEVQLGKGSSRTSSQISGWVNMYAPSKEEIQKAFEDWIPGSSVLLSPFIDFINWWGTNGQNIINSIKSPADIVDNFLIPAFNRFKERFISDTWPSIQTAFANMWSNLVGIVNKSSPAILNAINSISTKGLAGLQTAIEGIVGKNEMLSSTFDLLKSIVDYISPKTPARGDVVTTEAGLGAPASQQSINQQQASDRISQALVSVKNSALNILKEIQLEVGGGLDAFANDVLRGKVQTILKEQGLEQFAPRINDLAGAIDTLSTAIKKFSTTDVTSFEDFIKKLRDSDLGHIAISLINIGDGFLYLAEGILKLIGVVALLLTAFTPLGGITLGALIKNKFDIGKTFEDLTGQFDKMAYFIDHPFKSVKEKIQEEGMYNNIPYDNWIPQNEYGFPNFGGTATGYGVGEPLQQGLGGAKGLYRPANPQNQNQSWIDFGKNLVSGMFEGIKEGITTFITTNAPLYISQIQTLINGFITSVQALFSGGIATGNTPMPTPTATPSVAPIPFNAGGAGVAGAGGAVIAGAPTTGGLGIFSSLIPTDLTGSIQPVIDGAYAVISAFVTNVTSGLSGIARDVGISVSGSINAIRSAINGVQNRLIDMIAFAAANPIIITTKYVVEGSNPSESHALGGYATKFAPTWVGEFGKEIFVPKVPGWIVSHSQAKQALSLGARTLSPAMASGNITYNVSNFYGPQQFTVPSETSIYDFARSSSIVMG